MTEFSQVISAEILPTSYKNVIVTESNDFYEIRSNVQNNDDIISWCSAFAKNTNTRWIVNHTIPNSSCERMVCKRAYACQHSKKNKAPVQDNKNKRGISKNFNCDAKIVFKIKLTTTNTKKRDSYVRNGLPCIIKLHTTHNHPFASFEALKSLPYDDIAPESESSFTITHDTHPDPVNENETKFVDVSHIPNEFLEILSTMVSLQRRLGSSAGCVEGFQNLLRRLKAIRTPEEWETFLHNASSHLPLRRSSGKSKIGVQPTATAISRRKKNSRKGHNLDGAN